MQTKRISKILRDVEKHRLSSKEAYLLLKSLPYEDLGFAKIDHHRSMRKGFPEVIYCQGKTREQIAEIFSKTAKKTNSILATRADEEVYSVISKYFPKAIYNDQAKIISYQKNKIKILFKNKYVLVITAGTSDIQAAEEAVETLKFLGIRSERLFDVGVAGIHRVLDNMDNILNASLVIVAAGMDGVLPSVIGGLIDKTVIALPTSVGYGASFKGLAALLSMLNSCAPGIAVVNIDNGFGAACLAYSILRK